mgnify:CR=1 FL=1
MFSKIKNYKLILINKYDASAKEYNPKNIVLLLSSFSILIILIFTALLFMPDISQLMSLKSIQNHKKNNLELQSVIENQKNKINNLVNEIDNLNKRDDNMRSLLKLPLIDQDIRKLGVGGSSDNDKFNHIEYLLPGNINLNDINNKIDFLLRSVNLEKLSYSEIEDKINIDKEKVLHYPAIHPTSLDNSKFTSGFGYRYDPFTKNKKIHEGHDFSAKIGTEVFATANGIVKASRYFGSFGNYIEIDHGNGYVTTYGHLSKRIVKKGQSIQRGDIIGKVGNTGRSTAPHLHYEIKFNNQKLDPSKFYFDLSL